MIEILVLIVVVTTFTIVVYMALDRD